MAGKQLSRSTSHRRALRRNMAASLFEHGTIRTTAVKAKELRRFVERLITIAREGTLHARRRVVSLLQDREIFSYDEAEQDYLPEEKTVVQKLFDEIAPRYKDRPGGYTRIIRISDRRIGDSGEQVLLQLVEEEAAGGESRPRGRRRKRADKRHAKAGKVKTARPARAEEAAEEEAPPAEAAEQTETPDEQQTEAPAEEQAEESSEPQASEGEAPQGEETDKNE
jgi:large subunit ribosomal protein L17